MMNGIKIGIEITKHELQLNTIKMNSFQRQQMKIQV